MPIYYEAKALERAIDTAPSNLAELEDAERSRRIESLLKKGVTGW